jgi:hypothetical protein
MNDKNELILTLGVLAATTLTVIALEPIPSSLIQPGFNSLDLLSDHYLVLFYYLAVGMISLLWLACGKRVSILIVMIILVSVLFTGFWYLVSPNGWFYGGGVFIARSSYIANSGHVAPVSIDPYSNSLPFLFLIWAEISEISGLPVVMSAYASKIILSVVIGVFTFVILHSKVSTRIAFVGTLYAIVGNQYLFKGIEFTSLIGLVFVLVIVMLLSNGALERIQVLLIIILATAALFTYTFAFVITLLTIFLLVFILPLAKQLGLKVTSTLTASRPQILSLCVMLSACGAIWLTYIGYGWLSFFPFLFRHGTVAGGLSISASLISRFLYIDFLALPFPALVLVAFWYFAVFGLGVMFLLFYLLRTRNAMILLFSLFLASAFVVGGLAFFSSSGEITRIQLYVPFLTAPAISLSLMKIGRRSLGLIGVGILLLTFPTLVSYFPNIGSSFNIQYNETIEATHFVQSYFPEGGQIIFGGGISPTELAAYQNMYVEPYYLVSGTATDLANQILLNFAQTPGSIFPYTIELSYYIARVSGSPNSVGSVSQVFSNFIGEKDVIYENGMTLIAWN